MTLIREHILSLSKDRPIVPSQEWIDSHFNNMPMFSFVGNSIPEVPEEGNVRYDVRTEKCYLYINDRWVEYVTREFMESLVEDNNVI